jgi:hypothetical protein
MGMHGRSGQHIVIDFERSRIVVTNALYEDFNYNFQIQRLPQQF